MNDKLRSYLEVARANFLITSLLPVIVSLGAAVYTEKAINWLLFIVTGIGVMAAHSLTNMTNEYYDHQKGIDSKDEQNTIHALARGNITPFEVKKLCIAAFIIALICLLIVFMERGVLVIIIGLTGILGGFYYTAPPVEYKYKAWGEILIFVLMGPLLGIGAFLSITGSIDFTAVAASLPQGFIITAVLISNNIRDINKDKKAGIVTLPMRIGKENAYKIYSLLLYFSVLWVIINVLLGVLSLFSWAILIVVPFIVRAIKRIHTEDISILKFIDLETVKIFILVNLILILSLIAGRIF